MTADPHSADDTATGGDGQRRTAVACLQLANPDGEPRAERFERVVRAVGEAAATADLVVLPELWWTGYFAFHSYASEARDLDDDAFGAFAELSRRHAIHLVAGTFVERHQDGMANCAVVFGPDGRRILTYRKIHLFGYGSQESQLLTPGTSAEVAATELGGLAATTCYDLRFPELYRLLVDRGAELIIIPAAWPAARREHWRLLLRARAVENQAFVIGCNGAGTQEGVELAGHSVIVSPWGEVLAEAGADGEVLRAEVALDEVRQVREEFPVLTHRRIAVASAPEAGPLAGQPAG